ncbi:MAG TPA: tetratricopeptide repeat protein [Rhizomicrobium sp.]|jgi:Flp pilus assembly protein TadD
MVRAVALSAASALCLILAAGCASTSEPDSKDAAANAPAKTADAASPDANTDIGKNLPNTLDGEIQRADMLRTKGDYDEAARSYAQLMLLVPDDVRIIGGYGKVMEQQGHSKEALAFLKRAATMTPRDWSLQSALGVAYDQTDDHANARIAYQRALALKPGEASVLNNLAVSRMLSGDYANAKTTLAQAEARGVSNPKIELNIEKLASLNPAPAPVSAPVKPVVVATPTPPTASAPTHTGTAAVATIGAPATHAPVAITLTKPASKPVTASTTPKPSTTRVATTAPKQLSAQVVMEKVPVDPLAGPTKHHETAAQKLASTTHQPAKPAAAKPAAPTTPVAPPPALRTAADSN